MGNTLRLCYSTVLTWSLKPKLGLQDVPEELGDFSDHLVWCSPTERNWRGIYFLILNGKVTYIGKSNSGMVSRIGQHFGVKKFDRALMLPIRPSMSENALGLLEMQFIDCFNPEQNDTYTGPIKRTYDARLVREDEAPLLILDIADGYQCVIRTYAEHKEWCEDEREEVEEWEGIQEPPDTLLTVNPSLCVDVFKFSTK